MFYYILYDICYIKYAMKYQISRFQNTFDLINLGEIINTQTNVKTSDIVKMCQISSIHQSGWVPQDEFQKLILSSRNKLRVKLRLCICSA